MENPGHGVVGLHPGRMVHGGDRVHGQGRGHTAHVAIDVVDVAVDVAVDVVVDVDVAVGMCLI